MSTNSNIFKTQGIFSSYTEQILSHYSYAKIHSVFPNGFNLNFNKELIYVSHHETDRLSARGLTIDKKVYDFLHPHLEVGLHVRFRENKIVFYTRPNIFIIEFTKRTIKNLKLTSISKKKIEQVDLKEYLKKMDLLKASGFSKNQVLLNNFKEICKIKKIKLNHVKQMIGAGIGLTPSGDDFLQGLILMEQLIGETPYIEEMVHNQLKERSTTDISLSYYQALFKGYYNEDWIKLFEAVNEVNKSKTKRYLSLIKEYGKTSGYDILLGILTYLQII